MYDKLAGLYEIRNTVNNNYYIGSTVNFSKRRREHFSLLRKGTHYNNYLQHAFNKYGENNLQFNIILLCDRENTKFYEQLFLDKYSPIYNLSSKATGSDGSNFTDESRRKGGLTRRGVPKPESYKQKLSERMQSNKLGLGRIKSEEETKKLSERMLGNKVWLGKTHSEETKKKISDGNKGKIFSEETRKKMSESAKIRKMRELEERKSLCMIS